tara:strand:- start:149 stop:583 length:435 start_codon:yes stop_codon:yes gene_type:complete
MINVSSRKVFDFVGRLLMATTFAVAIPPKIYKFPSFIDAISNQGIPKPIATILLVGAIACLIGGVGYLVFDKNQAIGAFLLLLFIVPATVIMHFAPFQALAVFSNIGLAGGLLMVLSRTNIVNKSTVQNSAKQTLASFFKSLKN